MKKLMLLLTASAVMLFTGCSSKEANLENKSEVSENTEINKIEFINKVVKTVYFDFDEYTLDEEAVITTTNNSTAIKGISNNEKIILTGNTDEWGSDEYNYALGLKRAESVKSKMESEGVKNITTISLGESSPVCTEKTKDCWAKNRRVQLKSE